MVASHGPAAFASEKSGTGMLLEPFETGQRLSAGHTAILLACIAHGGGPADGVTFRAPSQGIV